MAGQKRNGQRTFNQKDILRDIRNYLAGSVVGITRDEILLEEVLKCAFCRIKINRQLLAIPNQVEDEYKKIFQTIVREFPVVFKSPQIQLSAKDILFCHNKFEMIDFSNLPRDFFGDAYEVFIGDNFRGQEGQFFTPLNAVDLLITMTDPQYSDTILDPACGAGSFLVSCANHITQKEKKINNKIYGIDKDQFLSEMTRIRLAIQYDSTFNIFCGDSLNGFSNNVGMQQIKQKKFSLILTNPPFGSRIISISDKNKNQFELAYSYKFDETNKTYYKNGTMATNVPPQVLFLERCITLLQDGGRLGIVIPESVLSSPKYRHVVQYILKNTQPLAVVGMPEDLFKTSGKGGTHTKVCLLVVQKGNINGDEKVFMAEAKWCGHDSRGRYIPHDDLPKIGQSFAMRQTIKGDKLGFMLPVSRIQDNILAPRFYVNDYRLKLQELREKYHVYKFGELLERGWISISTGDEIGKLSYGTGKIPFIRTSDISNWEIKPDPKHMVAQDVYDKLRSKQDVQEGDILLVRDGTYLIGTCCMITRLDIKMIYQSHIYKIRVMKGAPFNNYALLAILSSDVVQSQIKSHSFTQDIINSLGKRIEEIYLPFPKSKDELETISKNVQEIINWKIKTRELFQSTKSRLPNFSID